MPALFTRTPGLLFLMALVVTPLVLLTGPAKAQGTFENGNTLLSMCDQDVASCTSYVEGVADAMTLNMLLNQNNKGSPQQMFWFCWPPHATNEQIKDVAINYIRKHPEDRHFSAAGLVGQALQKACPCR